MRIPNYICLHHSAVSHAKNKDQFKANNRYHMSKWFFKSSLGYFLGYNYEISSKGKIYHARADGETTAACPQGNMNDGRAVHICLDGNFNTEKPTDKQIYALRDLLRKLVTTYKIERNNIVYHKDFGNTACPGSYMDGEKDFVRDLVLWSSKPPKQPLPNNKELILDLLKKITNLIKEKL